MAFVCAWRSARPVDKHPALLTEQLGASPSPAGPASQPLPPGMGANGSQEARGVPCMCLRVPALYPSCLTLEAAAFNWQLSTLVWVPL